MYQYLTSVTLFSYLITLYVLTCAVVLMVVRISVPPGAMRRTFILFGCLSPLFVLYIAYRVLVARKTEISNDELEQFTRIGDEIEKRRIEKFGGRRLRERIRTEYIRTLNSTAKHLERLTEKTAA